MRGYPVTRIRKSRWRGRALLLLALSAVSGFATAGGRTPILGTPRYEVFPTISSRPHPFDETQPLETRVRAYLDANCAYCHQPGGIGKGRMDLRFGTPLQWSAVFALSGRTAPDGRPLFHIRPGDIRASDIYIRMASLGKDAMPPLGRTQVDERGLALMRKWIESLAADSLSMKGVPRKTGPWILHHREQQELTLGQWNLGTVVVSAFRTFRIIHPSGRSETGISISARARPRIEGWTLRFSRPLPRGRYWIVIEGNGFTALRDLLVM